MIIIREYLQKTVSQLQFLFSKNTETPLREPDPRPTKNLFLSYLNRPISSITDLVPR